MAPSELKAGDLVLCKVGPPGVSLKIKQAYAGKVGQVVVGVGQKMSMALVRTADGVEYWYPTDELKKLIVYGHVTFGSTVIVYANDFPKHLGMLGKVVDFEAAGGEAFPVIEMENGDLLCLGAGEYEPVMATAYPKAKGKKPKYHAGDWLVVHGRLGLIEKITIVGDQIIYSVSVRNEGQTLISEQVAIPYDLMFTHEKVAVILNTLQLPTMAELYARDRPEEPQKTMSGNLRSGQDAKIKAWNAHFSKSMTDHALDVLIDYLDVPHDKPIKVGEKLKLVETRL